MTKMILSYLLIFFSMTMMKMNHPLSMGLMIIIQTMLICLLSGMLIKTYWFSYILFLIFLGGMLVMFIYVSSIASNEFFKIELKMKFIMFIIIMIMMMMTFINYYNLKWMNLNFNSDMTNFFNLMFFNYENNINLNKMYNNQTFLMMMMMIIYLFITLIAVVKITNIFFGPLRSSI